jgi:hypothetical protein
MAGIVRAAGARTILAAGTPPLWYGRVRFAPGQEARSFAIPTVVKARGSGTVTASYGGTTKTAPLTVVP